MFLIFKYTSTKRPRLVSFCHFHNQVTRKVTNWQPGPFILKLLSMCVYVQDEAPVDSNTVSSTEDQTSGDTMEPEHESPILETKQVPSPLV